MTHRFALTLVFLSVLGVATPTHAEVVGLSPTADVRILSFFPDSNEGNGVLLSTYTQPGNVQRTLMQFDLSGISAGQQIDSAFLTLFINESYGSQNPSNLNMDVHAITTAWLESQATWNSASAGNAWATPGGDFAPLVYATSTENPPALATITWDVTELVRDWYDGSLDNYGLLIKSFEGNGLTFNSRNNASATQPYLTVTHTAIPEPGSIALLSIGIPALIGIVRRQRRIAKAS